MTLYPPRLSLQRTLLLGNLAVSLPLAALVSLGDDGGLGLLALAAAISLSALTAWLLTRPLLAPIRSITAALRNDRTPQSSEAADREHPLLPTEFRDLIAAFDAGHRPADPPRRRASDARTRARDGTPGAPTPPRAPARLHDPALLDPVTGLANRRGLAEHLANVDGESPLDGTTAVHCLALTDLASVTCALGQHAADSVLREVARRLLGSVRASDLVARIGPAELAIVQHDVRTRENALSLAQRIRSVTAGPMTIGDWKVAAAVSIGIALAPSGAQAYTAWLIDAEIALQHARTCGAGAIMIFEDKLRAIGDSTARRPLALT